MAVAHLVHPLPPLAPTRGPSPSVAKELQAAYFHWLINLKELDIVIA